MKEVFVSSFFGLILQVGIFRNGQNTHLLFSCFELLCALIFNSQYTKVNWPSVTKT